MARYNTPLRYPGGKQRLAPFISELLDYNDLSGGHYAEPYAGGAGVAIDLLLDKRVSHVHLNDSSAHVAAFLNSLLLYPDEFCRKIAAASLSVGDWKEHRDVVRRPELHDEFEVGFSTFYLNRCNRSGVLTGGVIGGLAQNGRWRMDARFPRNELIRRVEAIAAEANHISVTNLDAETFMLQHAPRVVPTNSLIYCDPPYYERSGRLYLNSYDRDDHARLAAVIQGQLKHPWVVSYDGHPELIAMYEKRRSFVYSLQYSAIRTYKGTEVFIFSDSMEIPTESRVPAVHDALASAAAIW